MTIYKVRAWVNDADSKGYIQHAFKHEECFVKLEGARNCFEDMVNQVKSWELYAKYGVHVELFIPHINTDGSLSHWPSNKEYIDQYPAKGK